MIIEFLADGFEEIEALTPIDVLRRAGLDVKTVSIKAGDSAVNGAHGITVNADLTAKKAAKLAEEEKINMIIFPGGMPGAKNLDESELVERFLDRAVSEGAYVAAICAAPMIPGKRGLLRGRRATCFPGFEKYLDGADYTGGRVEVDGKFVTACGMGAALEFALTLTALTCSEEVQKQIEQETLKCGGGKKGASVSAGGAVQSDEDGENEDPMLKAAIELAVDSGKISTSLIQRKLSLGYGRAAKLIDAMENLGYVSGSEGQKPRRVLITKQQYMEMVLKDDAPFD